VHPKHAQDHRDIDEVLQMTEREYKRKSENRYLVALWFGSVYAYVSDAHNSGKHYGHIVAERE
jgi:hypothetical protein